MRNKKQIIVVILLIIVFMVVAYALYAQELYINGVGTVYSTWDVKIISIEEFKECV